jgi:hypothetical protein
MGEGGDLGFTQGCVWYVLLAWCMDESAFRAQAELPATGGAYRRCGDREVK